MSVNVVFLVGRLGQDPEIATYEGDRTRCVFSVATSRIVGDAREERVDWHRVVSWGRTAVSCGEYLQKGRQVAVEGRISVRKWTDGEDQPRRSVEVVARRVTFLGGRDGEEAPEASSGQPPEERAPERELPF
jgi:single-strand DNA-binding protein